MTVGSIVARFVVQIHQDEQHGKCPHVVAIHDPEQPDTRRVVWGAETMVEAEQIAEGLRAGLEGAAELDALARGSVFR